jgi:hypothetical protein
LQDKFPDQEEEEQGAAIDASKSSRLKKSCFSFKDYAQSLEEMFANLRSQNRK